ncbi:MAG: XRE family transcriptional regulator [Oscillospiraceae bacterium]|jgi:hypothetical protein|nr:XRE family transcriptional regulator [Oscillospiraceae bacterium]
MKKRTEELMQILEKEQDIVSYIHYNNEDLSSKTLSECLSEFLAQYDMKKADVINRSGLNQIYAYQIFAGTKNPSRDKVIALMFGFMMSVDDGNVLLRAAGMSDLYPRDKRDAVVIFGLNNALDVEEVDDLLFELGEQTIEN